jgi:hypothetical protein
MAGKNRITTIAAMALMVLLFLLDSAFAADKLFIVANQKSLDLAKDFLSTLNNESIPMSIVLDQYDKAKNEKFVIVLGGAKGPAGIDNFVKQVLTDQEQASANQPGGKYFVKENVFAQGQTIIVFTGPDEASAAEARKGSRKMWWEYLAKWFDLDTSSPMAY